MKANGITNIFGSIAGVPQILLGISYLESKQYGEAVAKIAEGVGILVMAYFVGKKEAA